MLHKAAREALNLSLKGHVVIIDEAHNIMDAISGIYSINVSLKQILRARAQLGVYLQRFRNRLKGKNRVYVAQIVRLLDSLTSYMQDDVRRGQQECLVNVGDLMAGKGVDQVNLYKLMRYLQESKLARKVEGYLDHQEQQAVMNEKGHQRGGEAKRKKEASLPVLTHIQSFLLVLTNPSAEGRFVFARSDEDACLKYMLLDPTHHFRDIVEEARAVILAGGTMSPVGSLNGYKAEAYLLTMIDERLHQPPAVLRSRRSNHDVILRTCHSQRKSGCMARCKWSQRTRIGVYI